MEPERLLPMLDGEEAGMARTEEEAHENMKHMIAQGLRAQLKTGSLLTGQLFVDLALLPDSPETYTRGESPYFEIPTAPTAGLGEIEKSVMELLEKIQELPLDRLITNAADAAEGLNELIRSPEVTETIGSAKDLLKDLEGNSQELNAVLEQAQHTLATVDNVLGPESQAVFHLTNALGELARAARSIRVLAAYLDQHPEALIKGKSGPGGN